MALTLAGFALHCSSASPAPASTPQTPALPRTGAKPRPAPAASADTTARSDAAAIAPVPAVDPSKPLTPSTTMFGTAAPLTVFAASAHPTWVGICQVRFDADADGKLEVRAGAHGELEGDRLAPILIDAEGRETPIEHFLGSDPSARYVAFTQGSQVWLRNTESNEQQVVSEWTKEKVAVRGTGAWPPAAFDPTGKYFAYFEEANGVGSVVLRELASGIQRRIEPGPGKLWNLQFEPDGALLRLDMLTRDNNGNGRLDGPLFPSSNPTCRSPIANYSIRRYQADTQLVRIYDLETRTVRDVPNFVASFGKRVITRGPDRELWLESETAQKSALSAASCNGRILHADAALDVIVVGCAKASGERRGLYLRRGDKLVDLKLDVAAFETDGRLPAMVRWLTSATSTEAVAVDLQTGSVLKLNAETLWLANYGDSALAERSGRVWLLSKNTETPKGAAPKTAVERDMGRKRPKLGPMLWVNQFVTLGRDLYDLRQNEYVGAFSISPLWLSPLGEALIAAQNANAPYFARGPLHWEKASATTEESASPP